MAFDNSYTAVTGATYAAADYNTYTKGNFTAIWVGTTAGDMEYYTSSTAKSRLAKGSAYQVLRMNSGATAPEWGGYIAGKALRTSNQSIANNTLTSVQFDSTELSRLVTWSSGDNTKLTIGVSGLYIIGFKYSIDGGSGYREANIMKNGSNVLESRIDNAATETTYSGLSDLIALVATNYLQLQIRHNHGSSINLRTAALWAVFVGV